MKLIVTFRNANAPKNLWTPGKDRRFTQRADVGAKTHYCLYVTGVLISHLGFELFVNSPGLQQNQGRRYYEHCTGYSNWLNSSYNQMCFKHSCRETQNTHFIFNNNFFFFYKIMSVYEIMWKKSVLAIQSTDYNIKRRVCLALHAGYLLHGAESFLRS